MRKNKKSETPHQKNVREWRTALAPYARFSPEWWLVIAKEAFAKELITEDVLYQLIKWDVVDGRVVIPPCEYHRSRMWDIDDLSKPLFNFYRNDVPYEVR